MRGPNGKNEAPGDATLEDATLKHCCCCHGWWPLVDFERDDGREMRTCHRCRERAKEKSEQARLSSSGNYGRRRFEHDWGIFERLEGLGEDDWASPYELMGLAPGVFQVMRARPRPSDRPGEEWWQLI